jgi:PIN domain nuclease of toxin-antitoxin system
MAPLLLDTCAAIWIFENADLSQSILETIEAAYQQDAVTFVSPISAWEVGQLVSRDRLALLTTPQRWFGKVLAIPGVQLADLSPDILVAASFLPGKPPRDPADRIILATARDLGATLITRDRALLAYGDDGHVSVVGC